MQLSSLDAVVVAVAVAVADGFTVRQGEYLMPPLPRSPALMALTEATRKPPPPPHQPCHSAAPATDRPRPNDSKPAE